MRFVLDPLSPTGVSIAPVEKTVVKQGNGYVAKVQYLDELQDVQIDGTPSDNQALAYDTATGKFIPQTISGGGAVDSVNGKTGAVTLDKSDVALGNVDNTSDANKPVSTATQTALNGKRDISNNTNSLYATTNTGGQTMREFSYNATSADTIPVRGVGGVLGVGTPTAGGHATTKTYVDTADALKVNKAGDTMSAKLNSTSSNNAFAHNRSGASHLSFGVNSIGQFNVYNEGSTSPVIDISQDGNMIALGGASNGTHIRRGTGFPNGVVSAPVGSIYIDKAITNGASSWIKKSGTGNTGWKVLEGSVARRIPNTDLLNGWTATGGANDTLWLKRSGNVVQLSSGAIVGINGTAATSNIFWTLPDGFRTAIVGNYSVIGADYTSAGISGISKDFHSLTADRTAGTVHSFVLQWITADDWPSTLPGIAG